MAFLLQRGVHGLGLHERVRVRPDPVVGEHEGEGLVVVEVIHEAWNITAEELAGEGPAVADDDLVLLRYDLADKPDDAGLNLAVASMEAFNSATSASVWRGRGFWG